MSESTKYAEAVRQIMEQVALRTGWSHFINIGNVLGQAIEDDRGPEAVIADLVAQYPPDNEEGRALRERRAKEWRTTLEARATAAEANERRLRTALTKIKAGKEVRTSAGHTVVVDWNASAIEEIVDAALSPQPEDQTGALTSQKEHGDVE